MAAGNDNLEGMIVDYLKEKQGVDIYSTEDGFLIYQKIKDDAQAIHINHVYVKPEKRKTRAGKQIPMMEDFINTYCKDNNINFLTGTTDLSQSNPEMSIKGILGYKHDKGYRFKINQDSYTIRYFMEIN